MKDLAELLGIRVPSTREGDVEVTRDTVVLKGITRFDKTVTIPLVNVQSIELKPHIGIVAPEFTIVMADGRTYSRRAHNGRKKIVQRFMDEAYTPIVEALAARGQE